VKQRRAAGTAPRPTKTRIVTLRETAAD
jgi:hypothetical protein